jgi:hypothetical protein
MNASIRLSFCLINAIKIKIDVRTSMIANISKAIWEELLGPTINSTIEITNKTYNKKSCEIAVKCLFSAYFLPIGISDIEKRSNRIKMSN